MLKLIFRPLFYIFPDIFKEYYYKKVNQINYKKILKEWDKKGRPIPPPPIFKQNLVSYFQNKYSIELFVETGTYMGDMVFAQAFYFKKIYSIELNLKLWKNAINRFKKNKHISILQGDSRFLLKEIISELNSSAIFWLDAHYVIGVESSDEKGCPIYEELNIIFKSTFNHIILIDDARLFNGNNSFPTLSDLSKFIYLNKPNSKIEIKDDIIRVFIY